MLDFEHFIIAKDFAASSGKVYAERHFKDANGTLFSFLQLLYSSTAHAWVNVNPNSSTITDMKEWRVWYSDKTFCYEANIPEGELIGIQRFDHRTKEGWYAETDVDTFNICLSLSTFVVASHILSQIICDHNHMNIGPMIQRVNEMFVELLSKSRSHPEVLKISKCIYGWNDDGSARVPMI